MQLRALLLRSPALLAAALVASLGAVAPAGCDHAPVDEESHPEVLGEAEQELRVPSFRLRTATTACDADPGVDTRRSLVIGNVASDPRAGCTGADPASCGPWSFGHLMGALAGSTDHEVVSEFIEEWLATWRTDQEVNGQIVGARPLVDARILDGWRRTGDGLLRLDDTPLKLIAIVNRFDLRDDEHYGGTDTAGQGRFVFGLYGRDEAGDLTPAKALQFHIIFEYDVPAAGCGAKLQWARRLRGLSDIDDPAEHRAELESLTTEFSALGVGHETLSQIRTNEVELGTLVEGTTQLFLPWELREFRIACTDGDACEHRELRTVTTKQAIGKHMMEPSRRTALWEWVSTYASDLASGAEFEIPETFVDGSGTTHPFLAGADESYTNRGGIIPLTPQRDAAGERIPYKATCRLANTTCGGCHRNVDEGCDNFDDAGRRNPLARSDLRTSFVMVSHLRPPPGAPFGFVKLSPFLTEKALPERQRDLCEFVARECKVKDVSSFVLETSSAH